MASPDFGIACIVALRVVTSIFERLQGHSLRQFTPALVFTMPKARRPFFRWGLPGMIGGCLQMTRG